MVLLVSPQLTPKLSGAGSVYPPRRLSDCVPPFLMPPFFMQATLISFCTKSHNKLIQVLSRPSVFRGMWFEKCFMGGWEFTLEVKLDI